VFSRYLFIILMQRLI